MYTDIEFLEKIKPMVIADMKQSGILASLTASQAFIESNKGNSGLAVKGNNLFGIKGSYHGQSVNMRTTEYYNGIKHSVYADFRKYPSWAESIADHSAMFNRLDRYKSLRGETDWKKATTYVKQDGYATAPDYTQTLQNVINKYRLYEWDLEAMGAAVTTKNVDPNANPYKEPTKTVKLYSKGEDVRWLQFELRKKGYPLDITGNADKFTIGALIDFQKKAFPDDEEAWDGICGPLTRAALKS